MIYELKLISTYFKRNVDDIDFYVGGLLERASSGDALIGPTFSCNFLNRFLFFLVLKST